MSIPSPLLRCAAFHTRMILRTQRRAHIGASQYGFGGSTCNPMNPYRLRVPPPLPLVSFASHAFRACGSS